MAETGVILGNYYVEMCCSPTRASIMSGRYPIHHTVNDVLKPDAPKGLPLNEVTLPELLRRSGYDTHMVGKWHLGFHMWAYTPTFRGFDSYFGYYEGKQHYFNHSRDGLYDMHEALRPNCGDGCSLIPDVR